MSTCTTTIYVLRLEGGRYYVGKTDDVMKRYATHCRGEGSEWTRKYKPLAIEKVIENVSPFEEDKITKMLMSEHGINNVRGGSYVSEELSPFHMKALKMEIWAAKDRCTRCGRAGHFVAKCYATTDVDGNLIDDDDEDEDEDEEDIWECDFCHKQFESYNDCCRHESYCKGAKSASKSNGCYRCGRSGHYASECYASMHIRGYYI